MHWSPLYEYDRRNVQSQAPAGQGVYALSDLDRIFYVGQCRNLKRRLLQHLKHTNTNHLVTRYLKRGCCFFRFAQIESARDLIDVERALIRRYSPPCNIDIRTIEEQARQPKPLGTKADATPEDRAAALAVKVLSEGHKTKKATDTQGARIVVFDQFTLVARDKELRCVPDDMVRDTDDIIAVVTRADAAKGFDTPFWQCICKKILQLQKKGKL